tara:strand:- start:166 stop:345 length:180 start_codon:yes stop_codon:yes gene_type:complete
LRSSKASKKVPLLNRSATRKLDADMSPIKRGITSIQDSKVIDAFFDVQTETLAEIRIKT